MEGRHSDLAGSWLVRDGAVGARHRFGLERGHGLRDALRQNKLLADLEVRPTFGSARIVLDKEFLQGDPATTDANHHCRSQDTNQTQLLAVTESVLSFSNLVHLEAIATSASLNLALDFIVNNFILRSWALFPIGSQSGQELLPINVAFTVAIEHVGHGVHFHSAGWELGLNNAINKVFSRNKSFVVLIHLAEQVSHA